LNRLPEVKEFLKGGHLEKYEGVLMTWISGHAPELTIMDDEGEVLEVVKLASYTTDGLHQLMEEKGFKTKEEDTRE
jgi:hypothetical protein